MSWTLVVEALLRCKDAVGVFYTPSGLDIFVEDLSANKYRREVKGYKPLVIIAHNTIIDKTQFFSSNKEQYHNLFSILLFTLYS